MSMIIKGVLVVLMLIGVFMTLYGGWQVLGTVQFVRTSSGRATAVFAGYYHETTRARTPRSSSSFDRDHNSITRYPEFTYRTADGIEKKVRESKAHVAEHYREGEQVEILLSPYGDPRLAGFCSLYGRDAVILVMGLGFLLLPFFFWKFALPTFTAGHAEGQAGGQADGQVDDVKNLFMEWFGAQKIGPVSLKHVLIGFGGFMVVGGLVAAIAGLTPFLQQMRFGAGGRLIAALEEKRFDDAQAMIAKGSGIHATNEFDQSPLLLTLEASQMELARKLIDAGADVNVRSKMNMTPLRVAAESGDMEMVRLLLSRGASPDAPEGQYPPFLYALGEKQYEIARVLIENGTDLQRRYRLGKGTGTVGDMAVLSERQDLVALIRKRGGAFSGDSIKEQ